MPQNLPLRRERGVGIPRKDLHVRTCDARPQPCQRAASLGEQAVKRCTCGGPRRSEPPLPFRKIIGSLGPRAMSARRARFRPRSGGIRPDLFVLFSCPLLFFTAARVGAGAARARAWNAPATPLIQERTEDGRDGARGARGADGPRVRASVHHQGGAQVFFFTFPTFIFNLFDLTFSFYPLFFFLFFPRAHLSNGARARTQTHPTFRVHSQVVRSRAVSASKWTAASPMR